MKKDNMPLIVAVFLAIGGLFSSIFVFNNKAQVMEVASARRNTELLISTALGAENTVTLFGAPTPSPITAVSENGALDPESAFSATRGAIKDSGIAGSGASPKQR